jgi:hypothetical protein
LLSPASYPYTKFQSCWDLHPQKWFCKIDNPPFPAKDSQCRWLNYRAKTKHKPTGKNRDK